MIDLDITFVIQFFNFLITLVVLDLLLIGPIRDILRKRAERMAATLDDVEGFARQSEVKMAEYVAALDAARRGGVESRNALREQGFAQEKDIVEAASREATANLQSSRAEIAGQVNTAMGALKADVEKLAQKITAKILA